MAPAHLSVFTPNSNTELPAPRGLASVAELPEAKSIYTEGLESLEGWNEAKFNVAFVPSEFSTIRAKVTYQERDDSTNIHRNGTMIRS